MKNRVRYICVPVTSFELADALPEHDKAVFIQQIVMMFKLCEAGEDPIPDQTENKVLDIALEGAAREIKKGYDTYVKRMNARQQSENQQRPITDASMIAEEEIEEKKKRFN